MRRKIKYTALLVLVFMPFIVWAAQKTITSYTWDSNIQVTTASTPFTEGSSVVENIGDAVTLTTDPDKPANPMVTLGNSTKQTCGAIWLGGAGTTNVTCTDNKCPFGGGFRTYFEFRITGEDSSDRSTDRGDGFTFTFMNGEVNDRFRRGGSPSGGMGEMMCYAGSDNTLNERGLDYPKMAVEFDLYPNTGISNNGCSAGRQDSSSHNNHIALMFWGDNRTGDCTNNDTHKRISYDDNIHGIPTTGSTIKPQNAASGSSGYYYRTKVDGANNWLEDTAWHLARVEVLKDGATNTYNVKAWVDCESCVGDSSTCTACSSTEINNYFKDILNQYYNTASPRAGSVAPKIEQTVTFSTDSSQLPSFEKVLYGFTVATGDATQTIQIRNFKSYFLPTNCTYVVATHACYRSNNDRVYVNANITGGTPSSVRWTLDGVDQGTLEHISGTLWGGSNSGCGLSDAARTKAVSVGTHEVKVTATGSCTTGSNSAQVTRP